MELISNTFLPVTALKSVADPGGHAPGHVKISHKKDGRQRPHRFHVSHPPYPAAGSATENNAPIFNPRAIMYWNLSFFHGAKFFV